MNVVSFPKKCPDKVGRYFRAAEFDCPCGRKDCTETLVDLDFVKRLDALREELGPPISIHRGGGYRCPWYCQNLVDRGYETAGKKSTHAQGGAADISTGLHLGAQLETAARKVGIRAVGVALDWVHVDHRADKDRRWTYSATRPTRKAV